MRKSFIVFICVLFIGAGGIMLVFGNNTPPKPDAVTINRAVIASMQTDNSNEAAAVLHRQITDELQRLDADRQNRDKVFLTFLFVYAGIIAATSILLYLYCEKRILSPFRKLQSFAWHIAAGNLDVPLEMDRNNLFGAFTESFDLMREELHNSREKEREADRSKKELVASLSHDIKTPVASIKSATELMLFTAENDEYKEQLQGINAKAEQIDSLITNMFHATLEELQALSVSVSEIQSSAIRGVIRYADYKKRARPFEIPSCLCLADLTRLGQVFDNIIGNSYKYAGTQLEISAFFEGEYLVINIADFGAGVPEEELPLIFTKFYRGKDAAAKSGYGLGLYISKYLIEQMSGDICCENRAGGFLVRVRLRLAG
ncbi:MAG TPA: sensor histidine kinase [Clostridiales bacterium]|nr:sensor histidine kinase [Clostridiales bacterium]